VFSSVFKAFQFMQLIQTIKWRNDEDIDKLLEGRVQPEDLELLPSFKSDIKRQDSLVNQKREFDSMMLSGQSRERNGGIYARGAKKFDSVEPLRILCFTWNMGR